MLSEVDRADPSPADRDRAPVDLLTFVDHRCGTTVDVKQLQSDRVDSDRTEVRIRSLTTFKNPAPDSGPAQHDGQQESYRSSPDNQHRS